MIVSESYLRFDFISELRSLRLLGEEVFPIVEEAAQSFLAAPPRAPDIRRLIRTPEVEIEEGSIKIRGLLKMTAVAFISYGEIRHSIDYLRKDGKAAAGFINDGVRSQLSSRVPWNTTVVERRLTPAPTRLRSLFDSVASGQLTAAEATQRAEEAFRKAGETDESIHRVMGELRPALKKASAGQTPRLPTPKKHRVAAPRDDVQLPKKRRIKIFRDRSGALRSDESQA